MKANQLFRVSALSILLAISKMEAATFYVNASNPAPVSPFNSWETAATNIQDAIDVTTDGDVVLVTNGIYACGGAVMAGDLTNRVAIDNAITVQSVNGPWVTTIVGGVRTNGPTAVRCAWLTNGASLIGFTLRDGATRNSGDSTTLLTGGGIWCSSTNALVGNCAIVSNTAYSYAAGIYQGTVSSSLIRSNGVTFTASGGAVYKSVLKNCTVVSNAAWGVVSVPAMTNCIIYFNNNNNYSVVGSAFSHCCTTPSLIGTGNFTTAPQLFADGAHLANGSPCIGAGTLIGLSNDLFGTAYSNPPSVGCAEWTPTPLMSTPQIRFTGDPVGFTVGFVLSSSAPYSVAWLKDGALLADGNHFTGTQTTNLIATGVSFSDAGTYQVIVSNSFSVVTSSVAPLVIHCVDAASTNSAAPYSTWAAAATNIQDAITAAGAGEVVLVTNGLYITGGKSMDGVITNRVSVDKTILVQSVNGANATVIQGAWDATATNGPGAIRCVWLTNSAIISGFTLTGGATRANTIGANSYGGGVSGVASATVASCIITGNAAALGGGGAMGTTLINCQIKNNYALGVPGYGVSVSGGGASSCNLRNCTVTGNNVRGLGMGSGGGTAYGSAANCAIVSNWAVDAGGGVYYGSFTNCTIVRNSTSSISYDYGGGAFSASLINCIVYANSVSIIPATASNYYSCTFGYSCSSPLPSGAGNISADPQFLADGFHLAPTSPCIAAGSTNTVLGTDIDGQIWNNPPSIGCDEWRPAPILGNLGFQAGIPPHALTFGILTAGQPPFNYSWSKDGVLIQDDGHHNNSGTASLVVNNFGPDDAGLYQVSVTNSAGTATSAVAQVVIHAVNAAGPNPSSPFLSWDTAATNIQDAINASAAGDIILVTNGIYSSGGMVMAGDLTNRVALNKALTVISVNGWQFTAIQGLWDAVSINGPGAVRCAWVSDGAVLNGFTLQNGATRGSGDSYALQSGGGVWCNSSNGVALNCCLTNNAASCYGGGIAFGTLLNSLVVNNQAYYGGGAAYATMNNCTVANNFLPSALFQGAGVYGGVVWNSILVNNSDQLTRSTDNYNSLSPKPMFSYSCSSPVPSGAGNINVNPAFLDVFHLSTISPCRGAGSAAYASGFDLDGEAWNTPPSMGCDEIVSSNLVGPLTLTIQGPTNALVNRFLWFAATIGGRAASIMWSFGDGPTYTNFAATSSHQWSGGGDYTVTATVFNNDNPAGVSSTLSVHIEPLHSPQMQALVLLTNGIQFQFDGQTNANYTVQYATNLVSPVMWKTLQTIYFNQKATILITDPAVTNAAQFYRVLVQ